MSTKVTRSSLISILLGSPIANSRPSGLSTTSCPADIRTTWTSPAGVAVNPDNATDTPGQRQVGGRLTARRRQLDAGERVPAGVLAGRSAGTAVGHGGGRKP